MWAIILFSAAILALIFAEYQVYQGFKTSSPGWAWLLFGIGLLLLGAFFVLMIFIQINEYLPPSYGFLAGGISLGTSLLFSASTTVIVGRMQSQTSQAQQLAHDIDLFQTIVDQMPIPMVLKDQETTYLATNTAYETFLGKDRQSLLGKKDGDFFPRSQANSFRQADELAMADGQPLTEEVEVIGAEGKNWVLFTRTPIFDGSGEPSGVLVTGQEVTELRRLKRTLEEEQRRADSLNNLVRFERLVASIASYFIDLEVSKINQGIEYSLRSIGNFTNVDRCQVLRFSSDGTDMVAAFEWTAEGVEARQENLSELSVGGLPGTGFGQMDIIQVPSSAELPAESILTAQFMRNHGIQSFTAVPLISERSVIGYLWLESIRDETRWEPEILGMFKRSAQIIVHALERMKRAETIVKEQEKTRRRLLVLEQSNRDNLLLNEMGDLLQVCRTVDESYPIIARYAQQLIPEGSGALYLVHNLTDPAEKVGSWGDAAPGSGEQEIIINECWALRRGRLHLVTDPSSDLVCGHVKEPIPSSTLCTPLVAQGETIGLLHLRSNPEMGRLDRTLKDYKNVATMIAEHIALALSNLSLRDRLRSQAIRDPLTGLFNRRYMEETLEREIRRANRHETPVGVIMFDVDNLKAINDSYGHDAGDQVLVSLGKLMMRIFRGEDVACRYGGDEFTIILPEASVSEVWQRAEQLRETFKTIEYDHEGKNFGPATLSIGISAYPDHGNSAERLLQISDAAAYAAKLQGRDRVMLGGEVEE